MYTVGVRVVGLAACVILFLFGAEAQEADADSLGALTVLDPVEISGTWLTSHGTGSYSAQVDSLSLSQFKSTSLSHLLQSHQGIYMKDYGPGMLSSVSMRGTSANHTSLLWNGLPVNYPSLGQADFSLIPVFFVDQVNVFYGGVSPLAGSGAIGGAIAISDVVDRDKNSVTLTGEGGSFGTTFSGIKGRYSGEKAGLSLGIFQRKSENNFTYVNKARAGQPLERQNHGAYQMYGYKAGAFWRPLEKGTLSFSGWFTDAQREIIPPYTVPFATDEQDDSSLRLSLAYSHIFSGKLKLETTLGRVSDLIRFNGLSSVTRQNMWNTTIEWWMNPKIQTRAGVLVNRIQADIAEYGDDITDQRNEFYWLTNWFATEMLDLSFNLRRGVTEGTSAPLSPSVGANYQFFKNKRSFLTARALVSGSYRVPTLNDKYWNPGGDPLLLPESGWNAEAGVDYKVTLGIHSISLSATAFGHWIDDWILWLPQTGGFWAPQNVRNVFSRGTDFSAEVVSSIGRLRLSNQINYKWVASEIKKGYPGDEGNIGNQLPYVPRHQGNWTLSAAAGKWQTISTWGLFGRRFTLADNDVRLASYLLWDMALERSFTIKSHDANFNFNISNLFNTSYENLQYRPMPGRAFSLQLNFTFNQNRK